MTIGNLLATSAAINSQETAIALRQEAISYQELDQTATILAQWFVQRGYRRADPIALLWPDSIELIMLFLACFRAGLIAVPVSVRLKPDEVAYVLYHSRAVLSFVHPELASVAEEASRGAIARVHTMPAISEEDVDAIALPIVGDDHSRGGDGRLDAHRRSLPARFRRLLLVRGPQKGNHSSRRIRHIPAGIRRGHLHALADAARAIRGLSLPQESTQGHRIENAQLVRMMCDGNTANKPRS